MSRAFVYGELSSLYKESIIIVLRKEGKKDYSLPGSYRPISLENALAKVVEKALANRITDAAEEHNLLPWNQMGARRDRSTLSAIGLLNTCVETAWSARPGSVVSMLSLDLTGAFDNVSHEKLLAVLKRKGFPDWLVTMIACFLQERRTRIAYTGHESDWISVQSGIPQGSPLSPILFLFYISELLESLSDPQEGLIGLGFIDDTNLITWSASAEQNCRRLTEAHQLCERWAERHGAKFAPEKYQLIHFTRNRRTARENLANSITIGEHRIDSKATVKLLGVWLDPGMTWKEHIAQAARKGQSASRSLARLATATWGPTTRVTSQLYSATIRPILLYGSQEWSTRLLDKKHILTPLETIQNECLRRVTGGYKRTPRAVLEKETNIPPLRLYIKAAAEQRALIVSSHQVEAKIKEVAESVWTRMRRAGYTPRPGTARERLRANAEARRTPPAKEMRKAWQARWSQAAAEYPRRPPTTWKTPWKQDCRKLYAGLPKAHASALFLMRSEVIGMNAWLASVRVPGVDPLCTCGQMAQTVRHVLLHCNQYRREDLLANCGTERLDEILSRPASAKYAARWLIAQGVLDQFRVAKEMENEQTEDFTPFQNCEEW